MITSDEKKTVIAGELPTILSELTVGLNKVYNLMKNEIGEEEANANMVKLGRLAVMPEGKMTVLEYEDEMIDF